MKKIFILLFLFSYTLYGQHIEPGWEAPEDLSFDKISIECYSCKEDKKVDCKKCGIKSGLFTGLVVSSGNFKDIPLYHPIKIHSKGNLITLEDAFGTYKEIQLSRLKGYSKIADFYAYLKDCFCDNQLRDYYVSDFSISNDEVCLTISDNSDGSEISTMCQSLPDDDITTISDVINAFDLTFNINQIDNETFVFEFTDEDGNIQRDTLTIPEETITTMSQSPNGNWNYVNENGATYTFGYTLNQVNDTTFQLMSNNLIVDEITINPSSICESCGSITSIQLDTINDVYNVTYSDGTTDAVDPMDETLICLNDYFTSDPTLQEVETWALNNLSDFERKDGTHLVYYNTDTLYNRQNNITVNFGAFGSMYTDSVILTSLIFNNEELLTSNIRLSDGNGTAQNNCNRPVGNIASLINDWATNNSFNLRVDEGSICTYGYLQIYDIIGNLEVRVTYIRNGTPFNDVYNSNENLIPPTGSCEKPDFVYVMENNKPVVINSKDMSNFYKNDLLEDSGSDKFFPIVRRGGIGLRTPSVNPNTTFQIGNTTRLVGRIDDVDIWLNGHGRKIAFGDNGTDSGPTNSPNNLSLGEFNGDSDQFHYHAKFGHRWSTGYKYNSSLPKVWAMHLRGRNLAVGDLNPTKTLDVFGEAKIRTILDEANPQFVLVPDANNVIKKYSLDSLGGNSTTTIQGDSTTITTDDGNSTTFKTECNDCDSLNELHNECFLVEIDTTISANVSEVSSSFSGDYTSRRVRFNGSYINFPRTYNIWNYDGVTDTYTLNDSEIDAMISTLDSIHASNGYGYLQSAVIINSSNNSPSLVTYDHTEPEPPIWQYSITVGSATFSSNSNSFAVRDIPIQSSKRYTYDGTNYINGSEVLTLSEILDSGGIPVDCIELQNVYSSTNTVGVNRVGDDFDLYLLVDTIIHHSTNNSILLEKSQDTIYHTLNDSYVRETFFNDCINLTSDTLSGGDADFTYSESSGGGIKLPFDYDIMAVTLNAVSSTGVMDIDVRINGNTVHTISTGDQYVNNGLTIPGNAGDILTFVTNTPSGGTGVDIQFCLRYKL